MGIIELVKRADVGIVICPSAALSMKKAGVRTYLGIDNIADLFMPVVDGDMWTECRMLMEACRHYDLEEVADWATTPPLHIANEQKEAPLHVMNKEEEPALKRARKEDSV